MGVSPAEAKKLSLWEYEALLYEWNLRHDDGEGDVEPPSEAEVAASFDMVKSAGLTT